MEGRAAMAMSRSDSDLAAIYDAMACGVVVRDAAGAVVFANAAAKRIFGRPPDELESGEAPGEDRRIREDGTTMPTTRSRTSRRKRGASRSATS